MSHGFEELTNFLISVGAKVDAVDKFNRTPMDEKAAKAEADQRLAQNTQKTASFET